MNRLRIVVSLPNDNAYQHEQAVVAKSTADGLGLDPSMVEVKLGDSMLPKAPVSGGSQSTASVMPA